MSEKTYFVLRTMFEAGLGWIWLILLALWGGTVNYISRTRKDKTPFSIIELVGEWTIAGFAGVITGFICMEYQVSLYLTFAAVAISGHAGGRAIFMFEKYVLSKIGGNK